MAFIIRILVIYIRIKDSDKKEIINSQEIRNFLL